MELVERFREKARKTEGKIVLPESQDERILRAAEKILVEDIAQVILLGEKNKINKQAEKLNLQLSGIEMDNPVKSQRRVELGELLYKKRRHKGLSRGDAYDKAGDSLYFATLLVEAGYADGLVAGAAHPTGDVLKPALQIVKTEPGIQAVSGAFIMVMDDKKFGNDGVLVMADCAVNPDVDSEILGEIAVSTAQTVKTLLEFEPLVAMLSFSTAGSARHKLVDKVQKATERAKVLSPNLKVDGEMQADAALVPEVAKQKAPDSEVAGCANVLIYPDLQSGNIGYKLVQRLAGAEAIGPVLQGMAKPVNDLSRGCSVEEIVNLTAITVLQSK